MKNLVLYSDQILGKSNLIDKELLSLLNKKDANIGYIPSSSDSTRKYYNEKVEYYEKLGITNLFYFDLDKEFDESNLDKLLQCDAIHLSGGDTAYFLSNIKKRNFEPILKNYVESGGILIGLSAGSIIMTEIIDIIEVGEEKEDRYDLKTLPGLGLVDFEFMPHWDDTVFNLDEFKAYSINSERTLYLCSDSDGIIVKDQDLKLIGNVLTLKNGIFINNKE